MTRLHGETAWDTGLIEAGDGCHAFIQSGGLNVSNAGLIVGPGQRSER